MRCHSRITLRQTLLAVLFVLCFSTVTLFLFTYRRDEKRFDRLSAALFTEEMTSNTLNMHYTLAYPENFGIRDHQAILPAYSSAEQLQSQAQTENLLSALHSLNPEKLPDNKRFAWSLLSESLSNSLAMSSLPYYEEPLSPGSGTQSQLPILLAEYTFRSERDVQDYLKLLDQTDEYLSSLLVFEQEKAKAGHLMPAVSLNKVIEQCDTILTKEALAEGSHFLQTTFEERINGLLSENLLTADAADAYLKQNTRLLQTVMLPAYEQLSDGLFLLLDASIPMTGLASKPKGDTYYRRLLFSQTGSSRSIEEIKTLLIEQFDQEYQAIRTQLKANPSLTASDYTRQLTQNFPLSDPKSMLDYLKKKMAQDFPPLDAKKPLPSVSVKTVSESLADYSAPAFYLTPPLDDTSENVIYINQKSTPAGLELFTTLAHEGYPGHMYQSVFYNSLQKDQTAAGIRELLWYGGYQEGWALYVEFIAYDYASSLFADRGQPVLSQAVQLEKYNRSLLLCLYSLLDIMIHYENASVDQVQALLHQFGITSEDSVTAIYEYITEEPANYLKYYLGYLELLSLKQEAKKLWEEHYSDYAFHRFFLECGPASFALLRQKLADTPAPSPRFADRATASRSVSQFFNWYSIKKKYKLNVNFFHNTLYKLKSIEVTPELAHKHPFLPYQFPLHLQYPKSLQHLSDLHVIRMQIYPLTFLSSLPRDFFLKQKKTPLPELLLHLYNV